MMDDEWYCMDICGLHVGGGWRLLVTEVEPPPVKYGKITA